MHPNHRKIAGQILVDATNTTSGDAHTFLLTPAS